MSGLGAPAPIPREQVPDPRRRPPAPWAAVAAALGSWGAMLAVYWLMVRTFLGQRLDALAFWGSHIGSWRISAPAVDMLSLVSTTAVALLIVVVMAIALLRRQWLLALEAAAVVGAANVTTQALKYLLFSRPDLGGDTTLSLANTLPSGHTTVAASASVAALLVVPPALRSGTALLGALITFAFGYATLVGQWHRPSDVVAGVLVAAGWAFAAIAVAGARRRIFGRRATRDEPAARPVAMPRLLGLTGLAAAIVSAVALAVSIGIDAPTSTRLQSFTAYAGGAGAVLATCLITHALLLRLHAADAEPARD